ncbi:MAG: SCP2 sterol-binding domain-containing protein [Actinomycetia bacterium]|nr:SCP2 sterol-binding domain-containing protein [Actinomycetes bacterium]
MSSPREALAAALTGRIAQKSEADRRAAMGVYQFHVTGPDGGDFVLRVDAGGATLEAGADAGAAVTVSADWGVLEDLAAGRANAFGAFMAGRISVTGSLERAMKLASLLG